MVHRLLKSQLTDAAPPANLEKQLDWICEHSSDQEREAEQASREATALKLCEFLAPQIGERFLGVITLVNTLGFMVRENTTTAEGFVNREDLPDGLAYDSERQRYRDSSADTSYRLGQPVAVILKEVDLFHVRLRFTLT
jgi:ribonuclease R